MTPANPRGKFERNTDRWTPYQVAFEFANRHGPMALIAVSALGFMAWLYITTLSVIAKDIRDHSRESAWVQRQTCINLAVLAGTQPALCEPPRDLKY